MPSVFVKAWRFQLFLGKVTLFCNGPLLLVTCGTGFPCPTWVVKELSPDNLLLARAVPDTPVRFN